MEIIIWDDLPKELKRALADVKRYKKVIDANALRQRIHRGLSEDAIKIPGGYYKVVDKA